MSHVSADTTGAGSTEADATGSLSHAFEPGVADHGEAAGAPFAALPNFIDLGSGEVCGPDGC